MKLNDALLKALEKAGVKQAKISTEDNLTIVSVTHDRFHGAADKILDALNVELETDSEKTILHGVHKMQAMRVPGTKNQRTDFVLEYKTISTLTMEIE